MASLFMSSYLSEFQKHSPDGVLNSEKNLFSSKLQIGGPVKRLHHGFFSCEFSKDFMKTVL